MCYVHLMQAVHALTHAHVQHIIIRLDAAPALETALSLPLSVCS